MTRASWSHIGSMLLVASGVSWFLKLIAIPTTGGKDFESGVVAFFYFAGLLGMLVGSTGLGSKLAEQASLPLYVVALALSPIIIWFVFMLLDEGLKPLGERGPDWYAAEAGITAMAILEVVVGVWLLRRNTVSANA